MTRIAILTDSTADLDHSLRERYNITVVPLNLHIGEEVFRDQIDITSDQFMERLPATSKPPTTSQPSSGLFEETFRALAVDHDAIVAVLISSKLSGTYQSAAIARDAMDQNVPIELVDSLNASLALGFQVIRAAELAAEGQDAERIASRLRASSAEYHIAFFVDTLEYLQRGGRIGRAAALVGSLLQLKPILRVDEGLVVPYERTRTRTKAVAGLDAFVRGLPRIEKLGVLYTSDPTSAMELADRFGDLMPREQVLQAQMSPVISTHVGPDAVGVAVFEGDGV
ncbi:MAG: DegV family protein [Chloroflexota bacterium]|nr:DegV family protein [Chloroflexota bacterium]